MSQHHDFSDYDSIEELQKHKQQLEGWGRSKGAQRAIKAVDDEIDRRIRLAGLDGPKTTGTTEASENAAEDDDGQWDDLTVERLHKARQMYSGGAEEADTSSGWETVVENIDEELARREEFGVAELSAGAIEPIGTSLGPETKVHGIAIGAGDTTLGKSKTAKKWGGKALRAAAKTLEGTPLVRDHENDSVDDVIGKVTRAYYDRDADGVAFEAEVDNPRIAEQIDRGRLDVSARIRHAAEDKLPTTPDGTLHIRDPEHIKGFENLSVVTHGASPSSKVQSGGLQ